jgi:N-acetylneuraminic acid mutarotase
MTFSLPTAMVCAATAAALLAGPTNATPANAANNAAPAKSTTANKKFAFHYSWASLAGDVAMPLARSDASATAVGGKILIAGGCIGRQVKTDWGYGCDITNTATLFDPATNTFAAVPDMPRQRFRHTAVAVGSKVFLLGGTDISFPEPQIAFVDVFDLVAKTWTTLPDAAKLTHAMSDPASFAIGTKIFFVGGYETTMYNATNKVWSYDTALAAVGWTAVADAPTTRGDCIGVTMLGHGYVFGGFTHENDFALPVGHLDSYDAELDEWTSLPSMKTVRGDKAGAVLHDRFHVIGGETKDTQGNSVPIKDVEVFDPSDGSWQAEGDIPTERFRFMAASVDDTIYIFGGQGKLQGKGNTSFYPVLNTVEAFVEKRIGITYVDAASTCSIASVIVALSVLAVAMLMH